MDKIKELDGLEFDLKWEFEGQEHEGVFKLEFYKKDGKDYCTIDKVMKDNKISVCIYNQEYTGFKDLIDELHEQGLEDIENYLWDNFGGEMEDMNMESLLEGKYPNALEIIQETGKLKLQNIDDGDLYLLIEELGRLGYECSINASSDNLIVKIN